MFKIDNTVTLNPDPNPDPNWATILDPDPNSMYLDPQHWFKNFKSVKILRYLYFCIKLACCFYLHKSDEAAKLDKTDAKDPYDSEVAMPDCVRGF